MPGALSPPAGLLLAAGAGRRMGTPKALVELEGEPLVRRALRVLVEGGCRPVVTVVGAAADTVRAVLPPDVTVVEAAHWAEGMGASLRTGLAAVARLDPVPPAVVILLVDLPGVTSAAVARLATAAHPDTVARATYHGRPGHPVLIGRAHWPAVVAGARGDTGARDYLVSHPDLALIECGDVADPGDVDTAEQLDRFRKS